MNTLNGLEALLAQANAVLKRAGEALSLAVEGMPDAGDLRHNFTRHYVRQQATSVASVALDVSLLVDHGRFENVLGLCRIGFESRISIYAAMRIPEFAAQKYLAGARGHVEELETMIKDGAASPVVQAELANHRRLLADLRSDFAGIQEKAWWKFDEVAKAAGLMKDYEEQYSTMSKAVHSTPTGLAAKTDPRLLTDAVVNLLKDTVEACAALAFFRQKDSDSPQPITTRWEDTIAAIDTYQEEYGNLRQRMKQLMQDLGA